MTEMYSSLQTSFATKQTQPIFLHSAHSCLSCIPKLPILLSALVAVPCPEQTIGDSSYFMPLITVILIFGCPMVHVVPHGIVSELHFGVPGVSKTSIYVKFI